MDLVPGMGDPEEIMLWEHVHPRKIGDEDWQRFEGYVAEIFQALGMDLATPGTRETPRRFLRAMVDSTMGRAGSGRPPGGAHAAARGGGTPRGHPPVYPNARGSGGAVQHVDLVLAGGLRRGPESSRRVLPGCEARMSGAPHGSRPGAIKSLITSTTASVAW